MKMLIENRSNYLVMSCCKNARGKRGSIHSYAISNTCSTYFANSIAVKRNVFRSVCNKLLMFR